MMMDPTALARRRNRKRTGGVIALIVLLPLAVVVLPTSLLLVAGLIPTLVAFVIDKDPEKSAPLTVGAINFCGVMPFAIQLWQKGHTMDTTLSLLFTPYTWVFMYGAAAVGWLIYFGVPHVVASAVILRDEQRIKDLEERRRALIEEWGPEVMGSSAIGAEPKGLEQEGEAAPEDGATAAAGAQGA